MKTKVIVVIIIIVLIIVAISCWSIMNSISIPTEPAGTTTGQGTENDNPKTQTVVDSKNIQDVYNNPEKYSDNLYEISTDKISVLNNDFRVEKATISEINDGMTIVYLDIVNQMGIPLSKDASVEIEFLDENGNSLGIIGGVVEEDIDIETGHTSTIRTQFLDRIEGIKGLNLKLIKPE